MPQLAVRNSPEQFALAIDEIRRLHGDNLNRAKLTANDAIRVGEILTQVKGALVHGAWITWVEENLPFCVRQAQKYLSVYDRRERFKNELSSHLNEPILVTNGNGSHSRPPQQLHESSFWTKSLRQTQSLMGEINHEIKDRPIESWRREQWISLAAAIEPLAEIYSRLKSLIG